MFRFSASFWAFCSITIVSIAGCTAYTKTNGVERVCEQGHQEIIKDKYGETHVKEVCDKFSDKVIR